MCPWRRECQRDSKWAAAIEAKSKLPEDILRELRKIGEGENVASNFVKFTNRRHTDHGGPLDDILADFAREQHH